MAAQVTNYQCPSCTGPLHFVGASGKLECDFCGGKYDVADIERLYAGKEAAAVEVHQHWQDAFGVLFRSFSSFFLAFLRRNIP